MSQLKIKDGNNWIAIPEGGIGVPSGGTAGQLLKKSSSTDYATEWANPPTWEQFLTKVEYSITPAQNANVSPYSYYAEQSISDDIARYGTPISLYIRSGGSTNPACCKFNSGTSAFWYYSAKNTATVIVVVFVKNPGS